MAKLDQLLQEVKAELGGDLFATDVVGMDGLSIATASATEGLDSTDASARFAMVSKLAYKVANKLGMGAVEDNLITTDKVYLIVRPLGDGSYYWGLTVTKDATLGMVRMLMNQYADQLWAAIPR